MMVLTPALLGTIDGAASKSSVTNANLFLDLAVETIAERQAGAAARRAKRASVRVKPTRPVPRAVEGPAPIVAPALSIEAIAPAPAATVSISVDALLASPALRIGVGAAALVLLILLVLVYLLSSRLSSLENQMARHAIDEHFMSKVAFLEFFVTQMHKNMTGVVRPALPSSLGPPLG